MSITGKRFSINDQQPNANRRQSNSSNRRIGDNNNNCSYQTLRVTGRTITLRNQIYQISNIARVGKYICKPKFFFSRTAMAILGFLGILFLAQDVLRFLGILMLCLLGIGIWERFSKKKKYVFTIESNGLTSGLFASTDEQIVDQVIEAVIEAMNHSNESTNYSFNIREGDLISGDQINQSGFFGTGIRN